MRRPGLQGPTKKTRECRDLVRALGLQERVLFLGFQRMQELLPRIGVNVLSSISEGLPLVVLEGFAAGVPAVATDVGACRQLIEGLEPADQALGAAGAVVPIANPSALADAVLPLLAEPARWQAASLAAIQRVERYYTEERLVSEYRTVYARVLGEKH
jgi:polysaccharide biosynthesis protein PelF